LASLPGGSYASSSKIALSTSVNSASFGAVLARSRVAGTSLRAVGCASRANGRSWSRSTGVVSVRNGRTWRSVGPSALAPGERSRSPVRSVVPSASSCPSAAELEASVPGSSSSVSPSRSFWFAKRRNTAALESTNAASWRSREPSSSAISDRLCISRRSFLRRCATSFVAWAL
jgi:hypothetical protein